jgi:hypothetical protein
VLFSTEFSGFRGFSKAIGDLLFTTLDKSNAISFNMRISMFKAEINPEIIKHKIRVAINFDNMKWETDKIYHNGKGTAFWPFDKEFRYKVPEDELANRKLILHVIQKKDVLGSLSVDLYSIATGPADQNWPVLDVR